MDFFFKEHRDVCIYFSITGPKSQLVWSCFVSMAERAETSDRNGGNPRQLQTHCPKPGFWLVTDCLWRLLIGRQSKSAVHWLVQWVRIGYFDFRETQFGIIRQITLIIISNLLMSARKHRFETIHKQRQDNGQDDDLFTQTFSMVHWVLTHIFGRHCRWVRNYSQGNKPLPPP